MSKVQEIAEQWLTRYRTDWPHLQLPWNVGYDSMLRLRKSVEENVVPDPTDVGMAIAAISLFTTLVARIENQRKELERFNEEKKAQRAQMPIRITWDKTLEGETVQHVLQGDKLLGSIYPGYTKPTLWRSGEMTGSAINTVHAFTAVCEAYEKRANIKL